MKWWHREITPGMKGPDVLIVQRKVGTLPTGVYDEETVARVKGVQSVTRNNRTGNVDAETAEALGEDPVSTPDWYGRVLDLWTEGEDVRSVRERLGLGDRDNRYDPDLEAAVRRFQSENQLPLTGWVDEVTARALG